MGKGSRKAQYICNDTTSCSYAAFTHGLVSRWNYLLRVVDWETLSSVDLQPLESAIQSQFIPAITGQAPPGKQIRELLALSVRLGGLGLQNPITMAREQHTASKLICAQLVNRIVNQDHHLGEYSAVQQGTKLDFILADVTRKMMRQRISKINYHLSSNTQWSSLKRKEHLLGLPCFQ